MGGMEVLPMPRKPYFPPYPEKPDAASGQARIAINRKNFYLGKHGSPESHSEYARLLAIWRTTHTADVEVPTATTGECHTIEAAVAMFWKDAQVRYRDSRELENFRYALEPLRVFFAKMPPGSFGPVQLRSYRRILLAGYEHPQHGHREPSNRRTVNRHVGRIKTVFRRLEMDGYVPKGTWSQLRTLPALEIGEDGSLDNAPIHPPDLLDIVLAWTAMPPALRAMALVQMLTGARPAELRKLRLEEVQKPRDGVVWRANLKKHKTAHKGKSRTLFFGPRARAAMAPLLVDCEPGDYIFSPRRSQAIRYAAMRAARQSKVQPSQIDRSGNGPKRPGPCYSSSAYRIGVHRSCERAGATVFFPYQLRHYTATYVANHPEGGSDLARIILGHSLPGTTGIYAKEDLRRAEAWMAKHG